jgi:hypothetical protein
LVNMKYKLPETMNYKMKELLRQDETYQSLSLIE